MQNLFVKLQRILNLGIFAINVSSLARDAKMAPPMIANAIAEYIKSDNFSINVVAGFINFKLEEGF